MVRDAHAGFQYAWLSIRMCPKPRFDKFLLFIYLFLLLFFSPQTQVATSKSPPSVHLAKAYFTWAA